MKCYHKDHEIVAMNEMLNVDYHHSCRTRSQTPQLVIPNSMKIKVLKMSLEHGGRILLNFLLQKVLDKC